MREKKATEEKREANLGTVAERAPHPGRLLFAPVLEGSTMVLFTLAKRLLQADLLAFSPVKGIECAPGAVRGL